MPTRRRTKVLFAVVLSVLLLGLSLRQVRFVDYDVVSVYRENKPYNDIEGKVLFAISSPPKVSSRRDIVRASWMSHIKKLGYSVDQVAAFFYMATPEPEWNETIDAEQKEYDDLFIVKSLKKENSDIANSIKTTEMLTQILNEECSAKKGCGFRWICKVDDDSYLVVKPLLEKLLLNNSITPEMTVIGRTLEYTDEEDGGTFLYPGGQFWCTSPDLLPVLTQEPRKLHPDYSLNGDVFFHDDVLTGQVLYRSKTDANIIGLPNNIAHDVDSEDVINGGGDVNAYHHGPSPESLNVHKMKKDDDYIKVANLYDENGWINK